MHEGGSLGASLFAYARGRGAPRRRNKVAGGEAPRPPGGNRCCARGLGAKGTEEQGLAGFRAPILRRPRAKKPAGLGAKGTEEQGMAGFRAPSPNRPRTKKPAGLGAKGMEV